MRDKLYLTKLLPLIPAVFYTFTKYYGLLNCKSNNNLICYFKGKMMFLPKVYFNRLKNAAYIQKHGHVPCFNT